MRKMRWFIIVITFMMLCGVMVVFVAGCGQQQANNEEFNASVIRALKDAYEKGEVDALDTFYAPDFIRHDPPNPDVKGLDTYKQSIVELRRVYPDFRLTAISMIMDGNKSATSWTVQVTDKSTGRLVKVQGCNTAQWMNGKVIEDWHHADYLGMYQQLGYRMTPPVTETTFARVTVTQMKLDRMAEGIELYKESAVPTAASQKGFHGVLLLSDFETGKSLSISLWNSEADAIANEGSGYYREQIDKFKDIFSARPVREGYMVTVQE